MILNIKSHFIHVSQLIDFFFKWAIFIVIFFLLMITEINSFDTFVDDLLESDEHILKGELDLLLMQYLFNSIELENIQYLVPEEFTYIAA